MINSPGSGFNKKNMAALSKKMLKLAESRGKDAAGIGIFNARLERILKSGLRASSFIKTPAYKKFMRESLEEVFLTENGASVILTHARLATNGNRDINRNNSPVKSPGVTGVHNGIILNSRELFNEYFPDMVPDEVDSRIFFLLVDRYISQGISCREAAEKVMGLVEGAVSFAAFSHYDKETFLGTNTGSLYTAFSSCGAYAFFASERLMLKTLASSRIIRENLSVNKVLPGEIKVFGREIMEGNL